MRHVMNGCSCLRIALWAWGLVIGLAAVAAAAPPTIGGLNDRTIVRNSGGLGPFLFTVGDDATDPHALTVSASSSNQALVPDASLALGGSGATRWMLVGTAQDATGTATITVTVSDGTDVTTASFTLTVVERFSLVLAEGSTGAFFDTEIVIGSPSRALVTAFRLTFFKEDGTTQTLNTNLLAPASRTTIKVDEIPGMESTSFSTLVESVNAISPEVSIERTMRWGTSRYGAHTEKAGVGPASQWFFAEGSQGFFFTYFLLVNPASTANVAHVTYFREGAAPVVRDYPLLPRSRRTIYAGDDAELVNTSFGARIDFDVPGMAERAMYFGTTPLFTGGHASAGATKPATEWFLAEGATGSFFSTFVLLANPDTQPATVTLTYLPASGAPIVKQATIAPGARMTRNIATEDAALTDAAVGVRVQSDRPIVVERSQYWPNPAPAWYEAHNSFGVTETAHRWGLGEGAVGGAASAQTYVLVANAGATAANVQATFLAEGGAIPELVKQFTVPAAQRLNIGITGPGSNVPELANQTFSVVIDASEPVAVEESLYEDVDGATWAAGTNATATVFPTRAPLAFVGPDRSNVGLGTTITLGVEDPIGGDPPKIFQWTLVSKPAGSAAVLSDPTAAMPTFVVDVAGDYVVELDLRRGFLKAAPERAFFTTTHPGVEVSVVATDASASEAGPDAGTFTFSRTGGDLSQPLTVFFAIGGSPSFNVPTPGQDYEPIGDPVPLSAHLPNALFPIRSVTIPASATSVAVTLTPRPDDFNEVDPEVVTVTIVPSRLFALGTASASISIADDDPPN